MKWERVELHALSETGKRDELGNDQRRLVFISTAPARFTFWSASDVHQFGREMTFATQKILVRGFQPAGVDFISMGAITYRVIQVAHDIRYTVYSGKVWVW